MEKDIYARTATITNILTRTANFWRIHYSWFPSKQNELYSEMDRIYKETRSKYGEEFFKWYTKERRLNSRICECHSKPSSYVSVSQLQVYKDKLDDLPFFYYYENCGDKKPCPVN